MNERKPDPQNPSVLKSTVAAAVIAVGLVAVGSAVLLAGCEPIGPDSCEYVNDGRCDEPSLCPIGTDTTDCTDTEPSFGAQTVPDQTYTVGTMIAPLVLPKASGGNAVALLSYNLTPEVAGLEFLSVARMLTGTPTAAAEGTHAMTYRVEDDDGDEATLRFDVRVNPQTPPGPDSCRYANDGECDEGTYCPIGTDTTDCTDTAPIFADDERVADQSYTAGEAIEPLVLPAASGGNGPLTYTLTPEVPGLTFTAASRTLRGTPTAAGTYPMTYQAEDSDGDVTTLPPVTADTYQAAASGTRPSFRITVGGGTVGPDCAFSTYPDLPDDLFTTGFDWCPASVDFQVRSLALTAESEWCAYKAGDFGLNEAKRRIRTHCDILRTWERHRKEQTPPRPRPCVCEGVEGESDPAPWWGFIEPPSP